MTKQEEYQILVEDFDRGGGREPHWEEAMAWNTGYEAGFKAAKKQLEDSLKSLDSQSDYQPDSIIMNAMRQEAFA